MTPQNYPNPADLLTQADKLDANAQAISDASEHPRLAVYSLRELAQAITDNATTAATPKRTGMTGEERRERRAAILRIRAARLAAKAANLHRHSHDIGSRIPFGQPILVGHHSERGHRRAIDRMHNATGKAISLDNYAEALETRANAVAGSSAILSSDADALEQLRAKLAGMERMQARMADTSKLVRRKDTAGLAAMGYTEGEIVQLFKPDFAGRIGFAGYQLTNNSGNMRRVRLRIAEMESRQGKENTETVHGDVRIVEDFDADRLRIFFPGKPSAEIRAELKSHGFRWSPTEGAWQRHIGSSARYYAEAIIKKLNP